MRWTSFFGSTSATRRDASRRRMLTSAFDLAEMRPATASMAFVSAEEAASVRKIDLLRQFDAVPERAGIGMPRKSPRRPTGRAQPAPARFAPNHLFGQARPPRKAPGYENDFFFRPCFCPPAEWGEMRFHRYKTTTKPVQNNSIAMVAKISSPQVHLYRPNEMASHKGSVLLMCPDTLPKCE